MNTDGRKLSREALADIRIKAVQRVEAGESPEDVIGMLGFHRSCIYRWIALYREGGYEALKKKSAAGKDRVVVLNQDSSAASLTKSFANCCF